MNCNKKAIIDLNSDKTPSADEEMKNGGLAISKLVKCKIYGVVNKNDSVLSLRIYWQYSGLTITTYAFGQQRHTNQFTPAPFFDEKLVLKDVTDIYASVTGTDSHGYLFKPFMQSYYKGNTDLSCP